jgi:hypothetical protein
MIRLLMDPDLAPGIVWLVTYLLHSTAWVAGAWLIWARATGLPARARNLVWRLALVAPLASTALQVGAGEAWTLGSFEWRTRDAAIAGPSELEVVTVEAPALAELPLLVRPPEPPGTRSWPSMAPPSPTPAAAPSTS